MCGRYVAPDTAAIERQWTARPRVGPMGPRAALADAGPPARFNHNARLAAEAEAAWLESGTLQAGAAGIAFHAVRKRVNSSKAEGPALLEPA